MKVIIDFSLKIKMKKSLIYFKKNVHLRVTGTERERWRARNRSLP